MPAPATDEPGPTPADLDRRAEALEAQSRTDEAALTRSEAADRTPDDSPALAQRLNVAARACAAAGLHRQASGHLRKLLSRHANDTNAALLLAQSLRLSGDIEGSTAVIMSLPEQFRSTPACAALLADAALTSGERAQAASLLDPHASARTRHVACATTFARLVVKTDRAAEGEAYLEDLLAVPGIKDSGRAPLLFRLGAMREAREDFEGAMKSYKAANTAAGGPDTSTSDRARVRRIIESFSSDVFANSHTTTEASRAVLVVGMPRSGTTLVERTIAAHPSVAGAGELPTLTQIALSLPAMIGTTDPYPACIKHLTPNASSQARDRYNGTLNSISADAERVVDKMPHNFMHLGLMSMIDPSASIVHVTRSPLDTCLSCYTSGLGANHTYARSFERLAKAYADYLELMAHWRAVLPTPPVEISYESFASDHARHAPALLEAIGLDWNEACARPQDAAAPVSTLSVDQVREPVNTRSVGRAATFGDLASPLRETLEAQGIDPDQHG